jgi:hypothetical protein
MKKNIPEELGRLIPALNGLECWYVSCGGAAGTTFQLALGGKIRRSIPLTNPAHTEEYRQFEGEASLLVWCAWRLDGLDRPLTSWDDTDESVKAGLERLLGTRVDSIEVVPPAWDMEINFSNSLCLRVFCDHVPGEPSFDGNWDLSIQNVTAGIGPGAKYTIEDRNAVRN